MKNFYNMELTPKERILRSIRGEEVDRPAWSPFLAYWWGTNPKTKDFESEFECTEACGADTILRGRGPCSAWNIEYKGTDYSSKWVNGELIEVYSTPVGELVKKSRYSSTANTTFEYERPVKTVEDLKTLAWIFEHAKIQPSGDADKFHREVGERALIMPLVGAGHRTCFESLVQVWVGAVNLIYMIEDFPDEIDYCLSVMRKVSDRTAEFAAETECEAFIFWENSSTTTTSPALFEKYASPEITAWGNVLHKNNKMLIHHACGHLKALLPYMAKNPIDAIESISPPPTGNVDISEAFEILPENIALIGGIEPVFFKDCTYDQLERRVYELIETGKGRRYVLANSDSCPPEVEYEKLVFVSELVKKLKK